MKSCLWLTSLLLVEDDSNPVCACSCPAGCYRYFRFGYPQSTIQNSEHLDQYELWIRTFGFMGPLPLKPRSGNDKVLRTLVVQAFAWSCMASMSTSICIRNVFGLIYNQSLHIPLVLYGHKGGKDWTSELVVTTLVFTREDKHTHICSIFHKSKPCVYGQLFCL